MEQKWGKLGPYLEQNRGKFIINKEQSGGKSLFARKKAA